MLSALVRLALANRLLVYLGLAAAVAWGLAVAPFDFDVPGLPRASVPVDAIPDLGENQQIVVTRWPGRSPEDVEDQVTYPLTSALLGVPGVRSVRSSSMFGLSSIYLVFEEDVEFYWSRSRVLEKLNALPAGTLPPEATPALGPDATALGQVFWYTLEGRDPATREPVGGWDLDELRAIQDFQLKYALSTAPGVAEVASVGGYEREYQVDVDPDALRAYGISLAQVMRAVRESNRDVGAATLELNLAEYFVRGLGYIEDVADLEGAVVAARGTTPIRLGDVARVNVGPAPRRGALDKSGAEAVGGVVVARYGANPMAVIAGVKERIAAAAAGLPTRTLPDGRVSRVTVVPFYDRSGLIRETIGTLEEALTLEILVTVIVVLLMLLDVRASVLVAATLPVAVLLCFVAMKVAGVDANVVALAGIAIAIGTMVDVGIVLAESILLRLRSAAPGTSRLEVIRAATLEVGSAVVTAVATTVISFLPVFTMEAAEGKLFRPLAYTKTFALVAAIAVGLVLVPVLARELYRPRDVGPRAPRARGWLVPALLVAGGLAAAVVGPAWLAAAAATLGVFGLAERFAAPRYLSRGALKLAKNIALAGIVTVVLARAWLPLGVGAGELANLGFVAVAIGLLVGGLWLVTRSYAAILGWLLRVKWLFLAAIAVVVALGVQSWRGLGTEFMPPLDEGAFLLMPTSMPHAGVQANLANLRALDMAAQSIPEVETVVGKAGRANTALDPAPMSMYENVILYRPEYRLDADGRRVRFAVDEDTGAFVRDADGEPVPDPDGEYLRQWRDHIASPDDIWAEVVAATKLPGVTSAPRLQPIETRLVMLQTGMRAPMGIKVYGTDLGAIEDFGFRLEAVLRDVPGVQASAVFADRIVGKPYLLLDVDRAAAARYGLTVETVQRHIQVAVGGMTMTTTVEGRERFGVRLRYPRELRDDPAAIERILVATPGGQQIPLGELAEVRYEQGPQSIKSEDGFLVGYVLFDRDPALAEVEVVEAAQALVAERLAAGALAIPEGVASYAFAGNYEQQVRAAERLALVVPLALALIFVVLYLQFRSVATALMVFSGVAVAFAGGFLLLAAYGWDGFLDVEVFGANLRDVFRVEPHNLSVAVWVGFLALFGIATDDGVLVATFLRDSFRDDEPATVAEIRAATVAGGLRRVRPAMMTTATTILALLPVLTSTGRGADIMIPMAIPSFGGMALQVVTMFTVPVLWAGWHEARLAWRRGRWRARPWRGGGAVALLALGLGWGGGARAQPPATVVDSLVATALRQNPSLRAAALDYRAARSAAEEVGRWPDLELAAAAMVSPVETRVGPQLARAGATQAIPFPGVRPAERALAAAKAAPLAAHAERAALEVAFRVRTAYYGLAAAGERAAVAREQLGLLDLLEEAALARVAAGAATTAQVYRVQLRRLGIAEDLELLDLAAAAARVDLAEALGTAAPDRLAVAPGDARAPELPAPLARPPATADLLRDTLALAPALADDHPEVRALDLERAVSARALELNRLRERPDFAVGLDYVLTGRRDDAADVPGDGRDAVALRAGIRIPVDRRGYRALETTERLRVAAVDARLAEARLGLAADAAHARLEAAEARERLASLEARLAVAAVAVDAATGAYAEGRGTLDEAVALLEQRLGLAREAVAARAQLLTARARLARALGITPPGAVPPDAEPAER